MILSKHQKEIVDKIISAEVFDIYTYLKAFNKGHIVKYDVDALRQKFDESEHDKTYKVMKDGHSTLTSVPHAMHTPIGTFSGLSVPMPRPKDSITDDEWELKPAKFVVDIPLSETEYDQQKYSLDFISKGVFVANDFSDIIDFISLWTYLKEQSLVLEVDEPIKAEDLGVFYQLNHIVKDGIQAPIQWETNFDNNDGKFSNKTLELLSTVQHDFLNEAPIRKATSYMDSEWIVNEVHKTMCSGFLGKKIIANSALRVFCKSNYKTQAETAQAHSLLVAWIAVGISVLAVLVGNILPLFQPKETDYLDQLVEQISCIQNSLEEIPENNDLAETNRLLDEIFVAINELKTSDDSDSLAEIREKIKSINEILLEN